MTVTAEAPVIPSSRPIAVTPVRQATAQGMLRLAAQMRKANPEMLVHQHLEDAADQVRIGNDEGALRHLKAAAWGLQPQSLHRHGIHDDKGHVAARQALEGVLRHHHLVRDIQDAEARNLATIARQAAEDAYGSPPLPHDPDAGYGPGALAARPTPRQPGGDQAMNAPARNNSGGADSAAADPLGPQPRGSKQFARSWDEVAAAVELAVASWDWDDLAAAIDLSVRTPMLETTPAPLGRPGGPGLYFLKGNKHSDYFENVVKALIEKRGMPPSKAYAIAWGALRRWSTGRNTTRKGHVTPVVQAAAGRALGQEAVAAAAAKAAHAHSVTWDDIAGAIELAAVRGGDGTTWDDIASVVELAVVNVKTYQRTVQTPNGPRVQTIVQHPQNYRQGMGQPAAAGRTQAAPMTQSAPARQSPPSRAAQKQRLLANAAYDRRQAALLSVQLAAFQAALYNALYGSNTIQAQKGATTTAQAGATTAATAGTVSSAQSAATAATTAGATPAQVTQTQTQAAAAAATMSVPQLQATVASLTAQIAWFNNQAAQFTAQAAKL